MTIKLRLLGTVALSASLASCTVGPDFERPATPATAAQGFAEGADARFAASPLPEGWWRLFEDPALDALVTKALERNTTVREASANLRQSRALIREAKARQLPSLNAQGSANTNQVGVGANAGVGFAPPQPLSFDFYQLASDASYEIDLFGGIRRSVEATRGDALAAQAELDAARVSVAAEVARNYALACSSRLQANIARESLETQKRTLDLTQRLFTAGRGQRRDVANAELLVAQAQAQVPQFEAEQRAALYALATLTGDTPSSIDAAAAACTTPPRVRTAIPVGDGAALLARRPDVRAAEARLAADTARIGVATAALYPSISLAGSLSIGGTTPNALTESNNIGFSIGPLISWSLPIDGAARARVNAASAQADARLAAFDGAVLTALQETEQALARLKAAIEQEAALQAAANSAEEVARITRIRFRAGRDNALQLLEVERNLLSARAASGSAMATRAEAEVSLFRALGGGWENAPPVQEVSATKRD
ncbi:NodT family efflux transporter outer membrane factor (OMF) lipoprotein [Blastomonas natatoria]|uniref:NodT family efflux transporter outer membrane factor (OMF) lipoprotein n=1 Tax=Blastomonas natatoria TaxID=34015 RepID=A0A2V3V4K2_9SPHN|nr:efflux transporter outer membrane subunit [Blastomonas natatoria]PXW76034.1 NodT family efflux transporter outer membrane factor (OMF) lipoprotein [Blastomonas natatoria]